MGDKPGTVIFEDGIDASDIRQGGLGDCYFLSSIAVLGNRQTRDKFVFVNDEAEWRECGAVCIKFFNGGKEQFVIIDDFLPLYENGEDFIFTSTPSGKEMWPMLIEKAFAKLYGSYSVIEGGLVDVCLSELTNGIPETFYTEREPNTAALWNKTMKLYKAGHFLGAGSPNSKGGDSDISPMGIVQSHAFSILRLVEADGHKLIQVRNPWGKGEWTGDWSDGSPQWTTRMQNLVGYTDDGDDGIFWMDFKDYVEEFTEIYVCKVFSERDGWTTCFIEDEWTGKPGEGIPNSKNRKAKFESNPNYAIQVTQPGETHIILRMMEKENAYIAKVFSYFSVQNIGGKKVSRPR